MAKIWPVGLFFKEIFHFSYCKPSFLCPGSPRAILEPGWHAPNTLAFILAGAAMWAHMAKIWPVGVV